MSASSQAIQDWYANQLTDYYSQYYRASLDETISDPGVLFPRDIELGSAAVKVAPAKLPKEVREAYDFYKKHVQDEDWGSVRASLVPAAGTKTYAVRVTTDGDDGFLEVYDEKGAFLAAGRTYLEVIAWGDRDWLRGLVGQSLPPELEDAHQRTVWGKPVEGYCNRTTEHACNFTPPGHCTRKAGHVEANGSAHVCSVCGYTWGGTAAAAPAAPEAPAEPEVPLWTMEVHETDGTIYPQQLVETEITIRTDSGPVKVPVADILEIDVAPRGRRASKKKGEPRTDVIITGHAKLPGTIEAETLRLYSPDYDRDLPLAEVSQLVRRLTLEVHANAFGSKLEFHLLGRQDGVIYGTDMYTLDSCLATAAVHAGVLKAGQTGAVRVAILPSPPRFEGSTRHGITSESWDEYPPGAFRFLAEGE